VTGTRKINPGRRAIKGLKLFVTTFPKGGVYQTKHFQSRLIVAVLPGRVTNDFPVFEDVRMFCEI
jgi:hypothetical protein